MIAARHSVWIVDDSRLDGARAAAALQPTYDVELFSDGSAALEQVAARGPPDVLVLDWVMPGISGLDVCRFIRDPRAGGAASVAILLLTGQQTTEHLVEGLSAGANDYLSKPYATAELVARVDALVRSRNLLIRAENAERTLRLLLDSAPDALLVIDQAKRISYANAEAERAVGVPATTLVGMPASDLVGGLVDSESEDDRPSNVPLADVKIRGEVYAPVVRLMRVDDGAGRGTLSLRNVTARRQREERRLDFYAIVAHDIRSPLNAIMLRSQALLSGSCGELDDRAVSSIRKICKNVESSVTLINDFLEFARLESPSYTMNRETLDLASVLRGVVDDLMPLVEAANHRLTVSAPDRALVVGDRARLAQVLMNLLGNAVKYTPPGGAISATLRCDEGVVEVAVKDNGPGIDASLVPTLTDRYVRGKSAAAKHGTGLGLMIVRQILEAHGSELSIKSKPAAGSTFSFRLGAALPTAVPLTTLDEIEHGK